MPLGQDGKSLWHRKVVVESIVECLPASSGEPAGKVTFGLNASGLSYLKCAQSVARCVETITACVARLADDVALNGVSVILLNHKTSKLVIIVVGRVVMQSADEVLVRALFPLGDAFELFNYVFNELNIRKYSCKNNR